MKQVFFGLTVVALVCGMCMTAEAKKLPVVTKGGDGVASLDVNKVETVVTGSTYKLQNWDSFDIAKGQTFKFTNNTDGIINKVTGKHSSKLRGTMESYTDAGTTVGGVVGLVNPKGIRLSKGFTFKGDRLLLSTVNTEADMVTYLGAASDKFFGVDINMTNAATADQNFNMTNAATADQNFVVDKGAIALSKKGDVTGSASFKLSANTLFSAHAKKTARFGNITLANAGNFLTIKSDKNAYVKDIKGTDKTGTAIVYAQNKVSIRKSDGLANLNLYGANIRTNVVDNANTTLANFDDSIKLTKFYVKKGSKNVTLSLDKIYNTKADTALPKSMTQKNFTNYVEAAK